VRSSSGGSGEGAARGWSNSSEGGLGAGQDQVGELAEEVGKRWVAGIGARRNGRGEFRRGARGELRCRKEEEEEIKRGDGVRADLYRRALR
jgi:hypothetical protein